MSYNSSLPFEFTRRRGFQLAISALSARYLRAAELHNQIPGMTRNLPPRAFEALTGSQFADSVSSMDRPEREHAILRQILEGNFPGFLRQLVPVNLSVQPGGDKALTATVFVMPDYLAIGSDTDFLRIPMNLHTAAAIADRFSFVLPTRKIVDAIYNQSACRFTPHPLPAGPQMTSTEYYRMHNAMIDKQSQIRGFPFASLVSGHKKDVVLTNRLNQTPGRIAIYGWHRGISAPIQPLSTVHGAGYADYSHGIRLVGSMALVEGKRRSVYELLQNSVLANVLSDEGTIRMVAAAFGAA